MAEVPSIDQKLAKILSSPGSWIQIRVPNTPKGGHRSVRKAMFDEIINMLQLMQIPYESMTRSYCIRVLKTEPKEKS